MTDADRYEALMEAGRQRPGVCRLCERDTEGDLDGPCCEACEREDYARQRAEDARDWLEKWGANEEADHEDL